LSENTQNSAEPTSAGATQAAPGPASELETKLAEAQQKYVYLYAEFDNFKKRAIKERQELLKFAFEPAAREMLGVADNLARAIEFMPEGTDKNLKIGIQMVFDQLGQTLQKQGVEVIQTTGATFDPNLHEAVGQIPSEQAAGTILQEHQKGYTLHGRLLRPSRVVVSAGPATPSG
jgi:molecular chaperone GrpE